MFYNIWNGEYNRLFLVEGFYVILYGMPVCRHFHCLTVLKIFAIHSHQRQTSLTCLARFHLPAEPSVAPHGPREPEEVWPKSAADGNKSRHMQTHSCRVPRLSRYFILCWNHTGIGWDLSYVVVFFVCWSEHQENVGTICQPGMRSFISWTLPCHCIGGWLGKLSDDRIFY